MSSPVNRPSKPSKFATPPVSPASDAVSSASTSSKGESASADPKTGAAEPEVQTAPVGSEPSQEIAAASEAETATRAETATSETQPLSTQSDADGIEAAASISLVRQQPIPPPSEPMQYRAIGLLKAKYIASDEQFTRGNLITTEGVTVDAVLLGRVLSLVKKHLDLEEEHLWVVYPRTRDREGLHAQIVGVWEPEKFHRDQPLSADEEASESDASSLFTDGYFSIRGEVVVYTPETKQVTVKIQQALQKNSSHHKMFKLNLEGTLTGKTVGYFWDLQVQRQGNQLVIISGQPIGFVPPRKKPKQAVGRPRPGGGSKFGPPRKGGAREGQRPQRPLGSSRPTPQTAAPPPRKEPLPKPVKRRPDSDKSS